MAKKIKFRAGMKSQAPEMKSGMEMGEAGAVDGNIMGMAKPTPGGAKKKKGNKMAFRPFKGGKY